MTLALYNIAHEHRRMVEALTNTQDDAQTIRDTIESESGPLEEKMQRVAYAPKILEAEADAIMAAATEMMARAEAKRKRAEHVREYLKTCMEVAGVTLIECPQFVIRLQKNPPKVEVWDEKQIPAKFWRLPEIKPPEKMLDKKGIAEAIKKGETVPGALLDRGTKLIIK